MLAALERLDGHRSMQMIGQRDGHRVDVWLLQQLTVIGVAAWDIKSRRGLAGALGAGLGQSHRRSPMAGA